jgi:perosamine synthetase
MERMAEKDIQTRPGTHAVHRLGCYVSIYGLRTEQFPSVCRAEDKFITLPIFHGMIKSQQDFVVDTLQAGL